MVCLTETLVPMRRVTNFFTLALGCAMSVTALAADPGRSTLSKTSVIFSSSILIDCRVAKFFPSAAL